VSAVLRSVFLTVWGFKSDGALKTPENTGENALEPVVGYLPCVCLLARLSRLFLVPEPLQVRFNWRDLCGWWTGFYSALIHPHG